jgi:hypothetical protein
LFIILLLLATNALNIKSENQCLSPYNFLYISAQRKRGNWPILGGHKPATTWGCSDQFLPEMNKTQPLVPRRVRFLPAQEFKIWYTV